MKFILGTIDKRIHEKGLLNGYDYVNEYQWTLE
jgi:hypothetical protein